MKTTTFKLKDIVAYKTNQPQVHLLEMFGGCSFNPKDIKEEEYIGWIRDVLPLKVYFVVSISPLPGFICLVSANDIIRRVDVNELTDKQKEEIHKLNSKE